MTGPWPSQYKRANDQNNNVGNERTNVVVVVVCCCSVLSIQLICFLGVTHTQPKKNVRTFVWPHGEPCLCIFVGGGRGPLLLRSRAGIMHVLCHRILSPSRDSTLSSHQQGTGTTTKRMCVVAVRNNLGDGEGLRKQNVATRAVGRKIAERDLHTSCAPSPRAAIIFVWTRRPAADDTTIINSNCKFLSSLLVWFSLSVNCWSSFFALCSRWGVGLPILVRDEAGCPSG